MPKTVENYSQEVGRAGRDGLQSTCVMFLASSDIPTLEGFCRGDTCSEKDLQLWLQEVVTKQPAKDGTLDFNHYKQSKEYVVVYSMSICTVAHRASSYDMRVLLRPSIIDTVTLYLFVSKMFSAYVMRSWNWIMDSSVPLLPFSLYTKYPLVPPAFRPPCRARIKLSRPSGLTAVVKGASMRLVQVDVSVAKSPSNCCLQIDVVEASEASGIERADLAKQISDWELDGWFLPFLLSVGGHIIVVGIITSKASQIRAVSGWQCLSVLPTKLWWQRYTVLKELPVTVEAIKKVAGDIYLRMLEREEEGIEKLRQVVAFATDDDCNVLQPGATFD
jgi:hypothetical protein